MKHLSALIAAAFLFLSLSSNAAAQQTFPNIKKLTLQNQLLQAKIDSLQCLLDSLTCVDVREEVIAEEQPVIEYTAEVSDSLLSNWYTNTQIDDYVLEDNYTLDSVTFVSKISDAEMIKRIEAINSYISIPFNQTVKNYIILYTEKMPAAMGKVLARSQYYMPIFEETFARYDLPLELKYMAVIESMLNPTATSRAGARGMWQFMYQTGRRYGLKINSFVDERLDVEKAADAAARYLADAYNIFGDWALAISSYNCGAGNVNKAIRRNGGHRDFWSVYPFLPRETRGYVPAFVGAMYAMTYFKEYGLTPETCPVPSQIDTFMITRNIHFKQISEVVGIPEEDLKELNPQYLHQIVPGNEGACVLKIPYSWSNAFIDVNVDSLYSYKSAELLSPQVIKNIQESGNETRTAYRVKSGDYLGRIATKYHVSVSQIMKWNHLKSTNLRVGQILYIYHNGAAPAASESSTASASSASSSSSSASSGSASGEYTWYTVKSGDSYYSIAQKYPGLSAQDIMKFNGVSSSKLVAGKKIKIPVK